MTTIGRECDTHRMFLQRPQRHKQVQVPSASSSQEGSCGSCGPVRRAAGTPRRARAGVCPRERSGEATDGGPGVHTPAVLSTPGLHPGAEGEAPRGSRCTRLTCGRPNRETDGTRTQQTTRIGKGSALAS